GDVAEHFATLAIFDFPEGLAAELEVVTLLIDRPASVAEYENAVVDTGHEIFERDVFFGRFEGNVGHAREGDAAPAIGMQTAVRFFLADERSEIACGLPVHKSAVLD